MGWKDPGILASYGSEGDNPKQTVYGCVDNICT